MIRRLLRWLFGPPAAAPGPLTTRVTDLELEAKNFTKDLEWIYNELLSLRGRVYALKRGAQEAPESTNDDEKVAELGPRPVSSTAHLARRFRSNG